MNSSTIYPDLSNRIFSIERRFYLGFIPFARAMDGSVVVKNRYGFTPAHAVARAKRDLAKRKVSHFSQ